MDRRVFLQFYFEERSHTSRLVKVVLYQNGHGKQLSIPSITKAERELLDKLRLTYCPLYHADAFLLDTTTGLYSIKSKDFDPPTELILDLVRIER